MLTLSVCNGAGVKACAKNVDGRSDHVELLYEAGYDAGDLIVVECDSVPAPLRLRFDPAIPEALVWLASTRLEFPVPAPGEPRDAYPPCAWKPGKKRLSVSRCDGKTWKAYRNLSVNPLDRRGDSTYFPHCTATVETRDESVFAARNTIDGVVEPFCHGAWPHQSWGDAEDPSAEITIEFGRAVLIDRLVVNLRADFPHDNWWKAAELAFSDGKTIPLTLVKTGDAQCFDFAEHKTESVTLRHLTKEPDDPSPFPALTQWAVYGRE